MGACNARSQRKVVDLAGGKNNIFNYFEIMDFNFG